MSVCGRDMNACAFRLQLAECGIADRTSRQAHKLVQPSVESCSEGKKSGEEQAEYNCHSLVLILILISIKTRSDHIFGLNPPTTTGNSTLLNITQTIDIVTA